MPGAFDYLAQVEFMRRIWRIFVLSDVRLRRYSSRSDPYGYLNAATPPGMRREDAFRAVQILEVAVSPIDHTENL
jgi:hypothetical protein